MTDRHDQEGLVGYARRLIAGISEPFDLSGQIVRIGVSIGVGTTTSLVLPWSWGVSSATLTIKDGLITGVATP